MKTIEIDNDVYDYLKTHSEPFIDKSPNDVLRKLLFNHHTHLEKPKIKEISNSLKFYSIPSGTPIALSQVLNLIFIIIENNLDRKEAVKLLSNKLGVSPTTIIDKFTRQLDILANKFDYLLDHEPEKLKDILLSKFPKYNELIKKLFNEVFDYKITAKINNKSDGSLKSTCKDYKLSELRVKQSEQLADTEPESIFIEDKVYKVNNWAELSIRLVDWLIDHGKLNRTDLPIVVSNSRRNNLKYFINTVDQHTNPELDAYWHKVQDFYVDTKYTAHRIVKNLGFTLEQLHLIDLDVKIKVALNNRI